ncbi:MAG TPA: GGDEF domain-containing protein, partial [Solirubrobacterales bacterium]|nr:GGDEF domain-containing protein [Solirubrobacterales bacterium]
MPTDLSDIASRTTPPRLIGTVGAYLFFAGAAATAAILLISPQIVGDTTNHWLLCLAQAVFGAAMLISSRLKQDWLSPLLIFGGILIISAAIALSGDRTEAAVVLGVFYTLPALFAGYFFSRATAGIVVVTTAVAYAAASAAIGIGAEAIAVRSVVIVAAVAGTALAAQIVRGQVDELVGRLDRLARVDPLTALINRRGFDERFRRELERSRRTGEPLAVALGDID